MTWCIESCNFDVDVDLLFQENLTIGQKMYVSYITSRAIYDDQMFVHVTKTIMFCKLL